MRLPSMRLGVLVALCLLGMVPAAALSEETQTPEEPPLATSSASAAPPTAVESAVSGSPSEARDLLLDMPYNLGGFEPDIVITRGAEHFTNLSPDDPTRVDLEAFLAAVRADIGDMDSGYALVSQEDYFSFVVAIRVAGVEPGSLLPAYLPILYGDLVDATSSAGNVGGKDVVVISSVGSDDQYVELFVYDQGDTIWLVQGPADVVETTLQSLPDPTLGAPGELADGG